MKRTMVVLVVVAVLVFVGSAVAVEPEFVKEYQIGGWKSYQISISGEVESQVEKVAEELRQYSPNRYEAFCEVVGRANRTGTFAENEVISDGRANNIASFLRANVFGINVYQWAGGEQADVMRVDVKCKFYVIPVAPVTKEEVKPEILVQKQELSPEEQQELARGIAEQLKALQKETPEKPAETVPLDTKTEAKNIVKVVIGLFLLLFFAAAVFVAINVRGMRRKNSPAEAGKKRWAQIRNLDRSRGVDEYYTIEVMERPDRVCTLPLKDKNGKVIERWDFQSAKDRARECIRDPWYKPQIEALLQEEETKLWLGKKDALIAAGKIKEDE